MPAPTNAEVRATFGNLMRSALIASSKTGNALLDEFKAHFGTDPAELPVMMDDYPDYLHINLQAGIGAFLAQPGRTHREMGVVAPTADQWARMPLADLLLPPSFPMPAPYIGKVEEEHRAAGFGNTLRCLARAVVFFNDEEGPGVLWINQMKPYRVYLDVMTMSSERTARVVEEIRELGRKHSPYIGQMFSLLVLPGRIVPQFEERPKGMTADEVILPPGLLDRVEEHVVGIGKAQNRLLSAGRHLKRGLLLWGRPGTGKTHTIRYLASQLPDATIMLLPGSRLQNLYYLREMIEICTPGIVVLDDVDFIAEDRSMPGMSAREHLFELLETLDGVSNDADLLFILTTNQADTLEPAVAARPGRVDQAAEIPPPDDGCRRQLFALYSRGVKLDMTDDEVDVVIKRTEGVTGSFFKELLRRAAVEASTKGMKDGDKLVVTAELVNAGIDEMLDPENPLTAKLLGVDTSIEHVPGAVEGAVPA